MARDVEERAITKCLELGTLEPMIAGKITTAHFTDLEIREVFSVLFDQQTTFGALPSL